MPADVAQAPLPETARSGKKAGNRCAKKVRIMCSQTPHEPELDAMNTITFPELLERSREPGTSRYSASSIAHSLDLPLQAVADLAKVHRNTLRTHPESPRLQDALRELMRVLSAAHSVQPDVKRAVFLIKNEPIPSFGHKTLMQLVEAGRADDAIGYLESVSAGYVG